MNILFNLDQNFWLPYNCGIALCIFALFIRDRDNDNGISWLFVAAGVVPAMCVGVLSVVPTRGDTIGSILIIYMHLAILPVTLIILPIILLALLFKKIAFAGFNIYRLCILGIAFCIGVTSGYLVNEI